MKVLTCNIRNFGAADGQDGWIHRKGLCIEVIHSQAADIICFQEMWSQQFADLSAAFPEYRRLLAVGKSTRRGKQIMG